MRNLNDTSLMNIEISEQNAADLQSYKGYLFIEGSNWVALYGPNHKYITQSECVDNNFGKTKVQLISFIHFLLNEQIELISSAVIYKNYFLVKTSDEGFLSVSLYNYKNELVMTLGCGKDTDHDNTVEQLKIMVDQMMNHEAA